MNIINICDFHDITNDCVRFISHITMLHIMTCVIDHNEIFCNPFYVRSVILTIIAVGIYHLIIKKMFSPIIKTLRKKCENQTTQLLSTRI